MALTETSLYIQYPDGTKHYLNAKIVEFHQLKHGMKTASGHPILDEQHKEQSIREEVINSV